jgi:hypothetical protein
MFYILYLCIGSNISAILQYIYPLQCISLKKATWVDKTCTRYTVCIIYFQILWCMVLISYPLKILSCTHCLSDNNKQRKSLGSLLFSTSATNVDNILHEHGGTHTHMAWSTQQRRTVPWLKQLFASLSPWRPRFNPRSVYVGFAVGKMALEQALFTIVSFSCQYYSTNAPHSVLFHQCPTFIHWSITENI